MTEKRFEIRFDGYRYFVVVDVPNERGIARTDTMSDAQGFLEMYTMLNDEIEELNAEKQALMDYIKKEHPKSYKHILEGL